MSDWTLFSNHGHVLVCLTRDSEVRLRDVASDVGITERAVQKIVHELQQAGFISIRKHGRCNRYEINTRKSMRHELEAQCTVGRLLQLFSKQPGRAGRGQAKGIAAPEPAAEKAASSAAESIQRPRAAPSPSPEPQAAASPANKKAPGIPAQDPAAEHTPDSRQQGSLF